MGVLLEPRATCSYRGYYHCNRWNDWGRWVAFGVIVGVALLAFFALSCFNARRRRRRGLRPYTGTAWMAPPPPYHPQTHQDPYNQPPPPPQYSQQPPPQGYFGGQPGIELQQPPNAYYGGQQSPYGGQPVYQPPPGPPPPGFNGKP
ncbi:hypothetical protein ASPSYDRAFT_57505 [Aspergillus sydowii CBS 593.65]|uniref:Chitin synthesis regulation, resistance to congo red-domain-containing protein n=1 Tax=Aspergillus sydowii CBS 593.65 TaxID=1036612 RepID=A0A1L9TKS4_9EURO|nr:uncharacterized protein ASPSYDRAFT_57505 [Aspergillus sydowii CBS 593.65]OJJ60027.1 hypothetical protein ASPSYDRAFT_57505 [Aspergillus sydowii CBS 593.65]